MFTANLKLAQLMIAMARKEGYKESGAGVPVGGSLSFRNNNPGNLRKSIFSDEQRDGFAYFKNIMIGWIAFQWDLTQKAKGNTVTKLNPDATLRQLIYTWAPPADNNDSEKYLQDVLKMTGFREGHTLREIVLSED